MSNTILTPTAVTRKALMVLHQKLNFVGSVNRQYDDSYAKTGAKIGDSLKIRLPNKYTVRTGAVMTAQDTAESSVTLQIATQKGVDLNFTSVDLTLNLDDFSDRIIEPAMAVLAAAIEADALQTMIQSVYNQVNDTSAATTFADILNARAKLNDDLAPPDNRTCLLRTKDSASVIDALKGLFQDSGQLSKQYREGYMGRAAGFDFEESTHLTTQARGDAASYVVNTSTGITSGTATITTTGGTGTINAGEIFTVVGVNRVHPETKVDTGVLQQFVVTTTATTTGAWAVAPTPITSGANQNIVINSAGSSKTVVIAGTASTAYGQSLVFQKNAFAFATADLVMPKAAQFAAREVYDGISMRIWQGDDITNDKFPTRLDVLYGFKVLRASQACRIANTA